MGMMGKQKATVASKTRQYRLCPTPQQEESLLKQIRTCNRVWNAIVEHGRFKGQRALLDCFLTPSTVGRAERLARKAFVRMRRAARAVEALRDKDPKSPKLPELVAKHNVSIAEKESADAAVTAMLPPPDAPFAKRLQSADITALRNAVPELKTLSAGAIHGAKVAYDDAMKSYFALLKQAKQGTLPPGMKPRPPQFRTMSDRPTLRLQVDGPILWRRSRKAQDGLIRTSKATHARYGTVRLPVAIGEESPGAIKFRLGGYGLPKGGQRPIATISRRDDGRWHVSFAHHCEVLPVGGRQPVGVDLGVTVPVALSASGRVVDRARVTGQPIVGPMSQDRPDLGPAVEYVERDGRQIKQRRPNVSRGLRLWTLPGLTPGEDAKRLRLERRRSMVIDRLRRTRDEAEKAGLRGELYLLKRQLAVLRGREADRKRDWIEQTTTRIARASRHVSMENLQIENMKRSAAGTEEVPGKNVSQKRGLNRAISKSGWGELRKRLEEKVGARGGTFVAVRPEYTSQTCSVCGAVDAKSRDGRWYTCSSCGITIHADTNAAINIRARGLEMSAASGKKKHGTDSAGGEVIPEASVGIAGASAISPEITSVGEPHLADSTSRQTGRYGVRAPLKARRSGRRSKPEKAHESGSEQAVGVDTVDVAGKVLE